MSALGQTRKVPPAASKICLAIAVGLLLWSTYLALKKYDRIRRWKPVEASVVDTQIINEPRPRFASDYRGHFTFRYNVDGRDYLSTTQSDFTTNRASEIRYWRSAFSRGSHHWIRYNPENVAEITTDGFDFRSFREPLWVAAWGAGLGVVSLIFKKLSG